MKAASLYLQAIQPNWARKVRHPGEDANLHSTGGLMSSCCYGCYRALARKLERIYAMVATVVKSCICKLTS